ncbi:hypothetical protein M413DRAFT_381186 [Hebeloma cylindrosporum]|uniref:DUF1996 domain-containing protein n=1 Tax=Hebeloma cylindrosporum TaxID=76867 RepID=A0A0C3CIJ8_HEBCY|nr:hypothetical protein M413DRAFT_381186 [Hebeloma cylindrosporum h7]
MRPIYLALIPVILSQSAHAWFRVACTLPLVQERVDPIVAPGANPSNHVHTVHGANHFAPNSTYDTLRTSTCTNCLVAEDLSNYWFPKLYFHDPNTKLFEPVPNGGLLVYYLNRGNGDKSNGGPGLKAFPPGFKMISGSAVRRARKHTPLEGSQAELAERAVEWECLRYPNAPGYNSVDRKTGFPDTDCEAGLNARIHMPACWDGVNVDSPNHVSHVAYLSGLDNGACPSTHPVPLLKLLYEVTWDVHAFASRWDPSKNAWPFVYATGDPTGYSWHADFQNGWETTALQNAIDKCNNPNDPTGSGITEACSFLTVTSVGQADKCRLAPVVNEVIDGSLKKLPGCNPLQTGPQDATIYSDNNCPSN